MAVIKVRIPTPLRKFVGAKDEILASGSNVKELIEDIERLHPDLKGRIRDENGKIRRFVLVFLNDEDIRFLDGEDTAIENGDELSIIPAISGG